jgi:hypothetical protein
VRKKIVATMLGGALFLGGLFTGKVMAEQTHMLNAQAALQNALNELNMAEANKGGHRERAIGLTQQALDEVQLGIDAGRR